MSIVIRDLILEDLEGLKAVSQSVWENDYAPLSFETWLEDENWHPMGVFEDGTLVSFGALQEVPGTSIGWVKALRTESTHHRQGYALKLVERFIDIAKDQGLSEIKYVTSSRNEASKKLAEKLSFTLQEQITSFRLSRPFPPRPKPSPAFIPLPVDASRVYRALEEFPDLIENEMIPVPFDFEQKNLEGLQRIDKKVQFFMIIDENGEPLTLYYMRDFQRNESIRRRVTIFSRERSTFVDTIARVIEETESTQIDNLGFFLGKNAAEWASTMMIIPEEMKDRYLILFTLNL